MLALLIGALAGTRAETISTTYVDLNGKTQSVSATVLTTETATLASGWYVVNSWLRNHNRIRVESGASVNLIITDNTSFYNLKGMTVNEGSSLTVWGQATSNGKWIVEDADIDCACIGGEPMDGGNSNSGVITINGCDIKAVKSSERGRYTYPQGAAIGGDGNSRAFHGNVEDDEEVGTSPAE